MTDLLSKKTGKKIDTEVTELVCVYDPEDKEQEKMSYIISVGWERKIHIWADEKEEEVMATKILPQNDQMGHKDDIMSAVYCLKYNLIFTGAHDGTLIAWNFETGYMKSQLHLYDSTCLASVPGNHVKESKSVDQLCVLDKFDKLVSMTADQ